MKEPSYPRKRKKERILVEKDKKFPQPLDKKPFPLYNKVKDP